MKKIITLSIVAFCTVTAVAQPGGKKPTTVPAKPAAPLLKNMEDSASYAVGISVANFYKQMGVKKLNTSIVSKAINDLLSAKKPLMDDNTANSVMNAYISKMQAQKSQPNVAAGEKFLAENKKKPGVMVTPSGLQYEIINAGAGEKPTAADSVTVHYRGTFLNGEKFDASYDRGEPITFALGGVIKGWTEGLQLMSVGAKYKLYVPYQLAYGPSDYMQIPGGSMLTFEVELLEIRKVKPAGQ